MDKVWEYVEGVLSEEIIVGKYVKLAVNRFIEWLERDDLPYYFNMDAVDKVLTAFSGFRHAKGRWTSKPFDILPWHAFILANTYGWYKKENDNRLIKKVYIKVARKNGKTEFLAGIGMYGFGFDNEKDPEIYWVATKKEQARIGWERQHTMIKYLRRDSPHIAEFCDVSRHRIFCKSEAGFVAYLGKDSHTEDGLSPYYALIDEYHAHPTDNMIDVIESGMGSRKNPMTWIITTAGFNPNSPCVRFEKVCKQILEGQLENDEIFPLIYDLDEGDDWNDESTWVKANPSIGVSVTMDFLRSEYQRAKTQGATKAISFMTKNLNIHTTVSETWISDDDWMKGNVPIGYEELKGRICYAGLDLASTRDTTSLCLLFPPEDEDGDFTALWWYWLPEEEAKNREQNDGIPYTQWTHEGWVTTTPGNVTDYSYIQTTVVELHELYNIQSIAYDRFNSSQVVINLQDEGVNMEPFGQGYRSMSAPTKQMERIVVAGRLIHGGNPVSRWQCSNIQIEMDAAENIKISKRKSNEKVDGMVSLVMAIGEWMDMEKDKEQKDSVYNERDMYVI